MNDSFLTDHGCFEFNPVLGGSSSIDLRGLFVLVVAVLSPFSLGRPWLLALALRLLLGALSGPTCDWRCQGNLRPKLV